MNIVGRKNEISEMKSMLNDKKAHMLAVIGRRRVGKTFLVRQVYEKEKAFELTGLNGADLHKQLTNFTLQMNHYFKTKEPFKKQDNWLLAFNQLSIALENKNSKYKPVIFFDELPWIAGKRSGFTEALAHWWNNWASQKNILVVICGSAASWMIEHVVNAKGGLHNRITKLIRLVPFTLEETKEFFEAKKIKLTNNQIVQIYMSIGGIPHYLEQVKKGKSAVQNIQDMCFSKNGLLKNEFDNLYPSLFDNAENHVKVIKALASKSKGLDRQEILKKTKMSDGGWFSRLLKELEESGFIESFQPLIKKKKTTLYRLTDEYSLFYINFVEGIKNNDEGSWVQISQTQKYKIWCGYAFENLCMKHIKEIKNALGISGVQSVIGSHLHRKNSVYEKGFQIDLLIDRKDDVINICEMKFYSDEFKISAEYAKNLRTKQEGLKAVTKTKKLVNIIFVSIYGVFDNEYKTELVDSDLKIEIFF
jgi:uncharacterized protein